MKLRVVLFTFFVLLTSRLALAESDFFALDNRAYIHFDDDGVHLVYADVQRGSLWWYDTEKQTAKRIVSLQTGEGKGQKFRLFSPRVSPDGEKIYFASYLEEKTKKDDLLSVPIYSVKKNGEDFALVTTTHLLAHEDPLMMPQFMTFLQTADRLLYYDYDAAQKYYFINQTNLIAKEIGQFMWKRKVLGASWAASRKHLGFVAQSGEKNFELWVASVNGSQEKKKTDELFIGKPFAEVPVAWSPTSEIFAYFTNHLDEKMESFRELVIQSAQESVADVLINTWGFPRSNIRWSKSGTKVAFLESKNDRSTAFKLVVIPIKFKKQKIVGAGKIYTYGLAKDSVLLGWDQEQEDVIYTLRPSADGQFFDLVKQSYDDDRFSVIKAGLPKRLIYAVDDRSNRAVFCDFSGGCQMINMSSGKFQFLTTEFSSFVKAGDASYRDKRYQEALNLYQIPKLETLEREDWIALTTRLYLAKTYLGKVKEAEETWNALQDRIKKGERIPGENLQVARILRDLGQVGQSAEIYQSVIDQSSQTAEAKDALYESGFVYRDLGNYDFSKNSFGHFAKLYEKDPRAHLALVELGKTFLLKDEPGKAIKVYRKVIKIANDEELKVRAILGKALALEKMNRFGEAKETYQAVLSLEARSKEKMLPETETVDQKYFEAAHQSLDRLSSLN